MKDVEAVRARNREYYKRYVEKNPEYNRERNKRYTKNNLEAEKARKRRYVIDRRIKAMKKISDSLICNRCGCDNLSILEINHINGGGTREKRENGRGHNFHSQIISGKRSTEDLELLCKLCNIHHYIEDILGITGFKVTFLR